MNKLRWQLRQWAGAAGWQGLAGLVLVAAAAALYLSAILPGTVQIKELQKEALSIREFSRSNANAAGTAAPSPETWLLQFYQLLPAKVSAPDWLRIIFAAARAQALSLEQGEYKMKVDKNSRLLTYEIALPVRGSYVQIRKFIADVLEQIPAVALDEIIIKREAIGNARIDASIRFTLFLNAS
jgi:Tfp pilus assembly protein PilO